MKYLVLGPGGLAMFSIFGFLKRMDEKGMLTNLKEISGSSAGALAAFCFLNKMSTEDVLKVDIQRMSKFSLKNLLKTGGLIKTDDSLEMLLSISNKTFAEMDPSVKLHVSAFSVDKHYPVYFSVDTTPDMRVADAVLASISIPFMFPPHLGHLDGSLTEEIPWTPFSSYSDDDILAIRIPWDEMPEAKGPMKMIMQTVFVISNMRAKFVGPSVNISIPPVINTYDFKMSHDDKLRLYLLGYSHCYLV
jgi:NTE family protein